ncbi:Trm112 family protein [bacterium]|nr:Trm112 family protein [bacterium]
MPIDPQLMEILACPACKTKVVEVDDTICCTNPDCRRSYAITDEIPVMLVDESTVLEPAEWETKCKK